MQQNKVFMPEIEPGDRLEILEANCYVKEKQRVQEHYTDSELQNFKNDQCELAIEIMDIEEEKKEAMKVFTDKMKDLKLESGSLLGKIRNAFEEVPQMVYGMDDQENGVMEFYTATGELVSTSPLNPKQRQTTMKPLETAKVG